MKDEMDILREVSSISSAHASTALCEILGTKIKLSMPALKFLPREIILDKLPREQVVLSVNSHILAGLKGTIMFILSEKSAFQLIDLCYEEKKKQIKTGVLTEMGISVIKEVGSIVIFSYVSALSIILKKLIIPSIPTLASGPLHEIMSIAIGSCSGAECILLIEAAFKEERGNIKGSFYLVLNSEAMKEIQEVCKKTLESLEK